MCVFYVEFLVRFIILLFETGGVDVRSCVVVSSFIGRLVGSSCCYIMRLIGLGFMLPSFRALFKFSSPIRLWLLTLVCPP